MPSPGRAVFSLSKSNPVSAFENGAGNDNGGGEKEINQTYSITVAPRSPVAEREAGAISALSRVMGRDKKY
jgi:hypothetical protein